MKSDLVMGFVFLVLALVMVFCIVINCINGAWHNLPICGFALGLNGMSAFNRFADYKRRKEWARLDSMAGTEEEDNEDNIIVIIEGE